MARKANTKIDEVRETKGPAFIAHTVTEKGEFSYWTPIGVAFLHKDGKGLSIELDALPANGGRIVLRTPKDETKDEGKGA
jgi:hypothetical protein